MLGIFVPRELGQRQHPSLEVSSHIFASPYLMMSNNTCLNEIQRSLITAITNSFGTGEGGEAIKSAENLLRSYNAIVRSGNIDINYHPLYTGTPYKLFLFWINVQANKWVFIDKGDQQSILIYIVPAGNIKNRERSPLWRIVFQGRL